jgi:hypothetical protein
MEWRVLMDRTFEEVEKMVEIPAQELENRQSGVVLLHNQKHGKAKPSSA